MRVGDSFFGDMAAEDDQPREGDEYEGEDFDNSDAILIIILISNPSTLCE